MSEKKQNSNDNGGKKKELEEVLRMLIDKIEISEIPKNPDDGHYYNPLDDEEDDDDEVYDDEEDSYEDLFWDELYDVFEKVQGNVPIHYMGPDVTTGLLGLIAMNGNSTVNLINELSKKIQSIQENEEEKIQLLKKQNELLMKILNK